MMGEDGIECRQGDYVRQWEERRERSGCPVDGSRIEREHGVQDAAVERVSMRAMMQRSSNACSERDKDSGVVGRRQSLPFRVGMLQGGSR